MDKTIHALSAAESLLMKYAPSDDDTHTPEERKEFEDVFELINKIKDAQKGSPPINILRLCLYALNQMPNTRINHEQFKNTYELAAMVRQTLTEMDNEKKEFPNGFGSWIETFYETAAFITSLIYAPAFDCHVKRVGFTHGTGGLYDLAKDWTNDFERINEGKQWDGEFFDEIESFLNSKNMEGII